MISITNKANCSGCTACYNSCPVSCIHMEEDEEGFMYPYVDNDLCINCGNCERVCPLLHVDEIGNCTEAWAAKCKNHEIRIGSSSGGMFSLIASKIIEADGTVFGAAFSRDYMSVKHIGVDSIDSLTPLRTSKYLQSDMGEVYKHVKELLGNNKKVLFSGVPCQIVGLKHFLQKDYDNLYCIDVICHGVPSPALWRKYLKNIRDKYNSRIEGVNFRHKKNGWQDFGITRTENMIEIYTSKEEDPYMQMFLRNLCLRPSCYECKIKDDAYESDITLGDFWGINRIRPEMNDGMGTSAVIVRTEKGRELFEAIQDSTDRKEVDVDSIKRYNPSLVRSVKKPDERDTFFKDMNELSFDSLSSKYLKKKKRNFKQIIASTHLWKKVLKPLLIRSRGGYR